MNAQERDKSIDTANQSPIYITILIGTAICILGTYLRFAFDSTTLSIVSWVILFLGAVIATKGVFKILNAK